MWTGRLTGICGWSDAEIDLAAVKQKGKAKKAAVADVLEIELRNVEKANLVGGDLVVLGLIQALSVENQG